MKRIIYFLEHWILFPLLIAISGLFLHEMGHGIVACFFGGTITYVEVMPGIELYPGIASHPWNGLIAQIGYDLPNITSFQEGFIHLMGSGTTLVISSLLLLILIFFTPRGKIRWFTGLLIALFPLDIITYSIFPALGWRHWIVFGGRTAEPVNGAIAMGIAKQAYYLSLGLYLVILYGVFFYWVISMKKGAPNP
jgi:hypothetical protein